MATTIAKLQGNTYAVRTALKADGWQYDSRRQQWYKTISRQQADAAKASFDGVTAIKGNKRGCQLLIDGVAVWTSKEYIAPAARPYHASAAERASVNVWNTDASGNIRGRKIRGSSPDDHE